MNKLKKNVIWIPIATAIISTLVLMYLSFGKTSNYTKQYSLFLQDITDNNKQDGSVDGWDLNSEGIYTQSSNT